jgi:hypothetical protein
MEEPEKSEYNGDPTAQIKVTLEVRESLTPGNDVTTVDQKPVVGYTYNEWWSLHPDTMKVTLNSKLAQIYEAATGMKFDPEEGIETDELIEKEFQARVVINKPGTRNRSEYESYGKVKRDKKNGKGNGKVENPGQTTKQTNAEELNEEDFDEIPF